MTRTRATLYARISGQCHIYMNPITVKEFTCKRYEGILNQINIKCQQNIASKLSMCFSYELLVSGGLTK